MNTKVISAFAIFLVLFLVIGFSARAIAQNMPWSSGGGDRVALISVEGMITGGAAPEGLFSMDSVASSITLVDQLYAALDDPGIKAVVLRINSPGGSAAGSDEVFRAVTALSEDKPVVVSMGDVAASGGYYIASAADYIFANGATLTGSIGVVFNLFNFEELADNIGVEDNTLTAGEFKDIGSPWRSMTDAEREKMREMMDDVHSQFISAVAEGRDNLTEEQVREVANGMIYTGAKAVELGLVDEIGGLHEAKAKARELAGLPDDAPVERMGGHTSFLDGLFSQSQLSQSMPFASWLNGLHPLLRLAGNMYLSPAFGSSLSY